MGDGTVAFFCRTCGGSVDASDASSAERARAEAGFCFCDECFKHGSELLQAMEAASDVEALRPDYVVYDCSKVVRLDTLRSVIAEDVALRDAIVELAKR